MHLFSVSLLPEANYAPKTEEKDTFLGRSRGSAAGGCLGLITPVTNECECNDSIRTEPPAQLRVSLNPLTFSCLKKQSILSSRNTRLEETSDWNTLGSFLSATRRPSRGSVTALRQRNNIHERKRECVVKARNRKEREENEENRKWALVTELERYKSELTSCSTRGADAGRSAKVDKGRHVPYAT
ncbi:hypothetical protein EVAR_66877_1 [Eumeta japonica]|uniref:Uncharacterized protein n=1 Tax=Eumeta variegata TaxID=151549 RepID=A0A4C1ZZP8_EUMVA|nr:hypothetical protein EVAR_66877_1 [Eumeta japonica]